VIPATDWQARLGWVLAAEVEARQATPSRLDRLLAAYFAHIDAADRAAARSPSE